MRIENGSERTIEISNRRGTDGPDVIFSNWSYSYKSTKKISGPSGGSLDKFRSVLDKVSGRFLSGKLNAVVGPSGSGRSCLLHSLAGNICQQYSAGAKISGSIRYGETPLDYSMKGWQRCGFVEATDIFLRDLTVRETLTYALLLRSESSLNQEEVATTVKSTLTLFQLESCENKKTKKLARGQLRLLSIAEELVSGNRLLFVDEPVSELNVSETAVVLNILKTLAARKYTVIASFHEPSAELFMSVDTCLILSSGRVAFDGYPKDAVSYFLASPYKVFLFYIFSAVSSFYTSTTHRACIFYTQFSYGTALNEVEFLLSISSNSLKNADGRPLSELIPSEVTHNGVGVLNPIQNSPERGDVELSVSSNGDSTYLNEAIHPTSGWSLSLKSSLSLFDPVRRDRALATTAIIFKRAAWSIYRGPQLWVGSLFLHFCLAILIIIIAGNIGSISNDLTAFISISMVMLVFLSMQFIFFLHKSNEVFLKEHSRGLYSYFAMWAVGSIPHHLFKSLNAIVFALLTYWSIGMNNASGRFGFYLLIVCTLCSFGGVLSEIVVYTSPTIRKAYLTFPGVIFILFYFSSLPVKPSTYAYW